MSGFKLSYGSVILDDNDISILDNELWFNDKLLTFMGEYLMETANGASEENLIHVFTPPETEMIRHAGSSDEVEMYFGMLGIDKVPLVAFIVNNNADVTRINGGSHWSLLVFDRRSDRFRHFDSMGGSNHRVAAALMNNARRLVGQKIAQKDIELEQVLQQGNSRDCGLFVAEYLSVLAEKKSVNAISDIQKIDKSRVFWRDLILNFDSNK